MGRVFRHFKRFTTAMLAAAMVITSVPVSAYAAQLDFDLEDTGITAELEGDSVITAEEAGDVSDEPAPGTSLDDLRDKAAVDPVDDIADELLPEGEGVIRESVSILPAANPPADDNEEYFVANQSAVSISKDVNGNYTIYGELPSLIRYENENQGQGASNEEARWIALVVNTGEASVTNVKYNGNALARKEEQSLLGLGITPATGRFILWVRIDDSGDGLLTGPRNVKLEVADKEDREFTIEFVNTARIEPGITILPAANAPKDLNEAACRTNQDAVTVAEGEDGTWTVTGDLSAMEKYASTNQQQAADYGATRWIGLIVDTGETSVTKVKYNGEQLTAADEEELTALGVEDTAGKFLLWVRADSREGGLFSEDGKVVKLSVEDKPDKEFAIKFNNTAEPLNVTLSVLPAANAPQDANVDACRINQDAVTVAGGEDGTWTVTGDLSTMEKYASTDEYQARTYGETRWIGLIVDTGEGSLKNVTYNGGALTQADEDELADLGVDDAAGKFILWVRADNKEGGLLTEAGKVVTIGKDGKPGDVTLAIRFDNTALPMETAVEILPAENAPKDINEAECKINQSAVSIAKDKDGNYTISGELTKMAAYESTNDYQRNTYHATKWIALVVSTGMDSVTKVSYGGSPLDVQEELDVRDLGIEPYEGKFILWLRADDQQGGLLEGPRTVKLSTEGRPDTEFTVSFKNESNVYRIGMSDADQAKLTKMVIKEFTPYGNPVTDEPVREHIYSSEGGSDLTFKNGIMTVMADKGNKLIISSVRTVNGSFVKVTKTVPGYTAGMTMQQQIGDYRSSSWNLGTASEGDFTVSLGTLETEDIGLDVTNKDDDEFKDKVNCIIENAGTGEDGSFHIMVRARAINNTVIYKLKNVAFSIAGGAKKAAPVNENILAPGLIDIVLGAGEAYEAAFGEAPDGTAKVTVSARLASDGYEIQNLIFLDHDSIRSEIEVRENNRVIGTAWDCYETEGDTYEIAYGAKAKIMLLQKEGFAPEAVYIISKADKDAIDADIDGNDGIPEDEKAAAKKTAYKAKAEETGMKFVPEDGSSAVVGTIDKMNDYYFVLVDEADAYYAEITEGSDVVASLDIMPAVPAVIETAANYSKTYTVTLYKGESEVGLKDEVTVKIGNEEVDDAVKAAAVKMSQDKLSFTFKGVSDDLQGKNVTVEFAENDETPQTCTVIFAVSKALDTTGIHVYKDGTELNGNDGFTLDIGGRVALTSEGIVKDGVQIAHVSVSGDAGDHVAVSVDGKGNINVKADPVKNLTGTNDAKLVISDPEKPESYISFPIAFSKEKITNATVTASAEGGFSDIVVTLENDVEGIEGLYYYVSAETTDSAPAGFKEKAWTVVPASQKKVTLSVADDPEAFSADPVSYTVSAKLVQISASASASAVGEIWVELYYGVNAYKYYLNQGDDSHAENCEIAFKPTEEGTLTVSTVVDGTFATRIKVKKSAAAPKKFFTQMGKVAVADVTYLIGKSGTPTVQKLKKVTLTFPKGEGMTFEGGDLDEKYDAISTTNNTIFVDTGYLYDKGTYKLTAYAVEPTGKEVMGTYKFKVSKGIESIEISTAHKVYKPVGKKASIKTNVVLNLGKKAYKPSSPKVKYFVVGADYKKYEYGVMAPTANTLGIAGITVNKKGVVKIAKNVPIGEGLKFKVAAVANDYKGNNRYALTDEITVTGEKDGIAAIGTADALIQGGFANGQSCRTKELIGRDLIAVNGEGKTVECTWSVKGAGAKLSKLKNENSFESAFINTISKTGKLKITAKALDGSKAEKTVTIKVVSDTGLVFELRDNGGTLIADETIDDSVLVKNTYGSGKPMYLVIRGSNGSLVKHTVLNSKSECRIVKKGIRYVRGEGNSTNDAGIYEAYYRIDPKKPMIAIGITGGGESRLIAIANTAIASSKTPTSVSAYSSHIDGTGKIVKRNGKIFNTLKFDQDTYVAAGSPNKVTYTVKTGRGKKAKPYNGKVLINVTKDYYGSFEHAVYEAAEDEIRSGIYMLEVDNGKLEIDFSYDGTFDVKKGTYMFTVTPVNDEGTVTAKAATVKVKAVPAPKAKLKLKTSVFNKFGYTKKLQLNKINNVAFIADDSGDGSPAYGFIDKKGVNVRGKINVFGKKDEEGNDIFELDTAGNLTYKGSGLTAADGYVGKKGKQSITGWVTVKYLGLDGSENTKQLKVVLKKVTPAPDTDPEP